LELNKIIEGDSAEVLAQFPADCVDCTITSPPYDDLREYEGYTFNFTLIATQLYRVTKPGGVLVWVVNDSIVNGNRSGTSFRQALEFKDIGFTFFDCIIMQKSGTSYPSMKRYTASYEFMFIMSKGVPKTVNLIKDQVKKWAGSWGTTRQRQKDGTLRDSTAANCGAAKSGKASEDNPIHGFKARTNIWPVTTGKGFAHPDGDLAYNHPATFPTTLAMDHIKSWSNAGDLVLDPMCGSGTTCVAAKLLGRNYIGIDVSAEYCALAEMRVGGVRHGAGSEGQETPGRDGEEDLQPGQVPGPGGLPER